jgi:putative oxidoreductase
MSRPPAPPGSLPMDLALLVLRLAGLGLAVFHGWGKLEGLLLGTSRFAEGVASMGFPAPVAFAWAAALSETVGGLLVFLGFGTRIAAALCAITMLVAAVARHHAYDLLLWKLGLMTVTPETAKIWGSPELALMYFMAFVALVLAGAGRLSLDRGRR